MGKVLQFRCVDENCPANFSRVVLSDKASAVMSEAGIFSQPNAGRCRLCGKPGAMDTVPQDGTAEQKAEHNQMLENIVKELRATGRLLKDILGKKAGGTKNVDLA